MNTRTSLQPKLTVQRPGSYINAEVTGGGLPGWLQRISGNLRTPDADFQQASKNYIEHITRIIAKAQITNGMRTAETGVECRLLTRI